MADLDIAKKILIQEGLALVVVKKGEVIYKSKDSGIKPMFIIATQMKDIGIGASLADRVIGKGAAILCMYIGIKEVYAKLISESGARVLTDNNILYSSEKSCSYIKNKDNTNICPIEKIAIDTEDPILFLQRLIHFFKKISIQHEEEVDDTKK